MASGILISLFTGLRFSLFSSLFRFFCSFSLALLTDAKLLSHKWESVRARRDNLLAQSDWVVTKSFETGIPVTDDWKIYRQALRDVPLQSDVDNISWPTLPS